MDDYKGWHVLYVKSQHEKKIDLLLREYELESFLPTTTTIRKWADRKKKITIPLFPTYIFLNIKSKKDIYKALAIKGVFKFLKFGGNYAKLRNDEIYRIKGFLGLEGLSEITTSNNIPKIGKKMAIDYGIMKGLECKVVKIKNNTRVFVKIESLNKNITAKIPLSYLTDL